MKHILSFIISLAVSFGAFAQSTDLLPEKTFTTAMEGAAHDSFGNIYCVGLDCQYKGNVATVRGGLASLYAKLPEGSVGNGIVFDGEGNMYIADYTGHNILRKRVDVDTIEVYAHNDGMCQPNDIAINPKNDIIYASDPCWKEGTGRLWLVKDGKITILEDQMGTTNGIEVSPSGSRLYVNESLQRRVWVYNIKKDGSLTNKRMLIAFPDYGMDGMRCDKAGRLWITRHAKGTVVILSPSGKVLKEVTLKGKNCSNITLLEGDDDITAYITMADRGCFEVITVLKKDIRFVPLI
ncbi:MAG: SMP-30/gluconolactonase/LRE family protein [Flavobacteriales bacterium]|nr:SMP-30/gluconolactonase/LRE family protein [Flavobacteriales bacterium]